MKYVARILLAIALLGLFWVPLQGQSPTTWIQLFEDTVVVDNTIVWHMTIYADSVPIHGFTIQKPVSLCGVGFCQEPTFEMCGAPPSPSPSENRFALLALLGKQLTS